MFLPPPSPSTNEAPIFSVVAPLPQNFYWKENSGHEYDEILL